MTACVVGLLCLANLYDHARLLREYVRATPRDPRQDLAQELVRRGIRYAVSDYWTAYDVAWLTQERVLVTPGPRIHVRMRRYREAVMQHWNEAVEITRTPCPAGQDVGIFQLCKPLQPLEPLRVKAHQPL